MQEVRVNVLRPSVPSWRIRNRSQIALPLAAFRCTSSLCAVVVSLSILEAAARTRGRNQWRSRSTHAGRHNSPNPYLPKR